MDEKVTLSGIWWKKLPWEEMNKNYLGRKWIIVSWKKTDHGHCQVVMTPMQLTWNQTWNKIYIADLNNTNLNDGNIWITTVTCLLYRWLVIVCFSSHGLNTFSSVFNNRLKVWYSSEPMTWAINFFLSHDLNNGPFKDRTGFNHLNTKLVCYSDPHITFFTDTEETVFRTISSHERWNSAVLKHVQNIGIFAWHSIGKNQNFRCN